MRRTSHLLASSDDAEAELVFGWLDPVVVMQYALRWLIADRCGWDARIVDVCCGPGLLLPFLYQRGHRLRSYTGLDVCPQALQRARARAELLDQRYGDGPFAAGAIEWVRQDVALPWPQRPLYDLAVYTRALEHLPAEAAGASLRHAAAALKPGGLLMLSASHVPDPIAQERGHLSRWDAPDLERLLAGAGFEVEERIGLLPSGDLTAALTGTYGPAAATWYRDLRDLAPPPLVEAITAAASPDEASEVLYQCRKR